MKTHRWELAFGAVLVALTAGIYGVHYLIFGDAHHIFIYFVGDIAFLPMEVLLVTLVLHRLLELRERRSLLSKLNMVIGAFFSEVGTELMKKLSKVCPRAEELRAQLLPTTAWSSKEFTLARMRVAARDCAVEPDTALMADLKRFLLEKRGFLLALLENPNLLEHESFTNVLWAVFHLAEELAHREELSAVPESDLQHLAGDIKRVYGQILAEWIAYMGHLKHDYPYLFSLAVRTNPFDPAASVTVAPA